MLVYSFIVVNKNKNYCKLKDIDMSISPIEKLIFLTEDVALLTKIFSWERRQIWLNLFGLLNIFLMFFPADFNLRKNIFQIDMTPSSLLWWIKNDFIYHI